MVELLVVTNFVTTNVNEKKLFHCSHCFEQLVERFQILLSEMTDEPLICLVNRFVQLFKNARAFVRDTSDDHSAVALGAFARNEAAAFQTIEQPRNIRLFGHHPLADLAAGQAFRTGSAQNSQRVILRRRQIRSLKNFRQCGIQIFRRARRVQDDFFLRASERLALLQLFLQFRHHQLNDTRYNNLCQDRSRIFEQAPPGRLQDFQLEFGKVFSLAARRKPVTTDEHHYYIDLAWPILSLRGYAIPQ